MPPPAVDDRVDRPVAVDVVVARPRRRSSRPRSRRPAGRCRGRRGAGRRRCRRRAGRCLRRRAGCRCRARRRRCRCPGRLRRSDCRRRAGRRRTGRARRRRDRAGDDHVVPSPGPHRRDPGRDDDRLPTGSPVCHLADRLRAFGAARLGLRGGGRWATPKSRAAAKIGIRAANLMESGYPFQTSPSHRDAVEAAPQRVPNGRTTTKEEGDDDDSDARRHDRDR